jgi:hypothetical protein
MVARRSACPFGSNRHAEADEFNFELPVWALETALRRLVSVPDHTLLSRPLRAMGYVGHNPRRENRIVELTPKRGVV